MLMFPGMKSYGLDCQMLANVSIKRRVMFGMILDFLSGKRTK